MALMNFVSAITLENNPGKENTQNETSLADFFSSHLVVDVFIKKNTKKFGSFYLCPETLYSKAFHRIQKIFLHCQPTKIELLDNGR